MRLKREIFGNSARQKSMRNKDIILIKTMKGGVFMDKNHPAILIEHIEEAKDWLDKAKSEYTQANPTRGEIILNLAQAEVKHAWELSRNQSVKTTIAADVPQKLSFDRKKRYWLPMAASIIVLIGMIFSIKMGKVEHGTRNLAIMPKPLLSTTKKMANHPASSLKEEKSLPNQLASQQPSTSKRLAMEISKQVTLAERKPMISKHEPQQRLPIMADSTPILPQATVEPEGKTKVAQVEASKNEKVVISETTPTREHLTNSVPVSNQTNQTRIKPVAQFSIDEEALTREASHSLRNGK